MCVWTDTSTKVPKTDKAMMVTVGWVSQEAQVTKLVNKMKNKCSKRRNNKLLPSVCCTRMTHLFAQQGTFPNNTVRLGNHPETNQTLFERHVCPIENGSGTKSKTPKRASQQRTRWFETSQTSKPWSNVCPCNILLPNPPKENNDLPRLQYKKTKPMLVWQQNAGCLKKKGTPTRLENQSTWEKKKYYWPCLHNVG